MTLTRTQLHDLLYLVRASSFVPGMTKERQNALELSLTQELCNLDKLQSFVRTVNYDNFENLKTKNKALATRLETLKQNTPLVNSLGTKNDDWKDMPIYVYSSLEAFGHYLINQKPNLSLTDWQSYPDPLEHVNYVAFAKDFLETFADGSDYLWDKTNNLIFEFQQ